MKPPELKSVWFVTSGRVHVLAEEWEGEIHDDGTRLERLRSASGTVRSGDNLYEVTIADDGNTCTCDYGRNHSYLPKDSHSHDEALRIEAERARAKEADND